MDMKRGKREGWEGELSYTCRPRKSIADPRGSVEDVLRFAGVNILQRRRCVCEQADGIDGIDGTVSQVSCKSVRFKVQRGAKRFNQQTSMRLHY